MRSVQELAKMPCASYWEQEHGALLVGVMVVAGGGLGVGDVCIGVEVGGVETDARGEDGAVAAVTL